jgi:hypothetical protein
LAQPYKPLTITPEAKALLLEAADAIELLGKKFRMETWLDGEESELLDHSVPHTCGSAACIGGTMNALWFPGTIVTERGLAEHLELGEFGMPVLYRLFYPDARSSVRDEGYIVLTNAKVGALMVRHLAETGEVDWSVADDFFKANPGEEF